MKEIEKAEEQGIVNQKYKIKNTSSIYNTP